MLDSAGAGIDASTNRRRRNEHGADATGRKQAHRRRTENHRRQKRKRDADRSRRPKDPTRPNLSDGVHDPAPPLLTNEKGMTIGLGSIGDPPLRVLFQNEFDNSCEPHSITSNSKRKKSNQPTTRRSTTRSMLAGPSRPPVEAMDEPRPIPQGFPFCG